METGETTGEDWRLPGSARAETPHRQAVWLNAFHREAVSFKGLYVAYDPRALTRRRGDGRGQSRAWL
jgi:hypothetical protein